MSARALTVVVDSESDKDDGGLVATSSSVDDTANAEARDEVNEIQDGEDHLAELEAFDIDGQPEIDNDGNDSEQRNENVIVCQDVEWHICDCVSDDVRVQPRFSAKLLWVDGCCAVERIPIQYFNMSIPTQMGQTYLSGVELQCQSRRRKWTRQSSGGFSVSSTPSHAPSVKGVTCGVFKMEFSLLPDL